MSPALVCPREYISFPCIYIFQDSGLWVESFTLCPLNISFHSFLSIAFICLCYETIIYLLFEIFLLSSWLSSSFLFLLFWFKCIVVWVYFICCPLGLLNLYRSLHQETGKILNLYLFYFFTFIFISSSDAPNFKGLFLVLLYLKCLTFCSIFSHLSSLATVLF